MITKGSSIPMNIFHFINLKDPLIYIKQKQQSYVRSTDPWGHALVPLSHVRMHSSMHVLNTAFIHRSVRPPSTFNSPLSDFLFFSSSNYSITPLPVAQLSQRYSPKMHPLLEMQISIPTLAIAGRLWATLTHALAIYRT